MDILDHIEEYLINVGVLKEILDFKTLTAYFYK